MDLEVGAAKSAADKNEHGRDFPLRMVESLDRETSRLGVPRQSLIMMLITRHLDADRASEFRMSNGRGGEAH